MSYRNYNDSARRWFTEPNADFKARCVRLPALIMNM